MTDVTDAMVDAFNDAYSKRWGQTDGASVSECRKYALTAALAAAPEPARIPCRLPTDAMPFSPPPKTDPPGASPAAKDAVGLPSKDLFEVTDAMVKAGWGAMAKLSTHPPNHDAFAQGLRAALAAAPIPPRQKPLDTAPAADVA